MRGRFLTAAIVTMMCAAWIGVWQAARFTTSILVELDRVDGLTNLEPRAQATLVFDRAGRPAFTFFVEQRIDVPLENVSRQMIDAILAVEDRRYYSHHGIDPIRVAGAAWRNLRAGRIVQGGSTITQQLARASQLTPERTYSRKIREVLLAVRLEERYSKSEILEEVLEHGCTSARGTTASRPPRAGTSARPRRRLAFRKPPCSPLSCDRHRMMLRAWRPSGRSRAGTSCSA